MDSIDIFCHCLPPVYCEAVERTSNPTPLMFPRAQAIRAMVDIDERLRIMDGFPGYQQVLSLASPTPEVLANPTESPDLVRIGNDAMAEMVAQHPARFPSFIGSLPMNNPDAAVNEARRVVEELNGCGVQIYSNVAGRPLDQPEFLPVFEVMADLNLPIWLHPIRPMTNADYPGEEVSKFDIWWSLGWPYETSVAMVRLAFAAIFDRFPNLVIITHHVGGVIPLMAGRLGSGMELLGTRNLPAHVEAVTTELKEPPLQAVKRFYADTASFGSQETIECGRAFFGVDRLLFATDMPFDPEEGPGYIRATLEAIQAMELSAQEREQILVGNAKRLLKLK